MIGTWLAHYEVKSRLGSGGMGEVFLATDSRLGRSVAIKLLPVSFSADPDRLSLFRREAQVLASLNHSNIAHVYGLEEIGDKRCIVMELIEGETLQARIRRGAIPIDEALAIAKQIAGALETAHEKGIVHRDLKPGNVMITPDGTAKVLDFGLAKAVENSVNANASESPTIMSMATGGAILGTASYMSPEQARGKSVDRRSDIFSFGAVLFEMLTGKQAFPGEDVGEILATVVKTDPDWTSLPPHTPASIATLLKRCLRKNRQQRLGDAGAVRIEIEEALSADAAAVLEERRQAMPKAAVLVGLIAIVVAFAAGWLLKRPAVPQTTSGGMNLIVPLPAGMQIGDPRSVTISPNGQQVAFVASQGGKAQLYIRPVNTFEARPIPETIGAANPFFSPDGESLGFFADNKLKKVSVTAGVVTALADTPARWASWGSDDNILFLAASEVLQIPANGGSPRSLMKGLPGMGIVEALPGGKAVLYTAMPPGGTTSDERSLEVLTIATGERKALLQGANFAGYVSSGHLIFIRAGTLWAVPFDLAQLRLTGTPVPVIQNIRQSYAGGTFRCSSAGSCVYVAGGVIKPTANIVDRATGKVTPLRLEPSTYRYPRFSPKADKIVFWIEQQRCYLVVYDILRGSITRLIADSDSDNHSPTWMPDGQRITFLRQAPGDPYRIFSILADGSGTPELLPNSPKFGPNLAASWSPDGVLAFTNQGDIWLLSRSSNDEPRPFFQSKFTENQPAFSPDGHWLAYVSDETGRSEVYIRPFPGPGAPYPISTEGGTEPVWARDELFYRSGSNIFVSKVNSKPAFTTTRPVVVLTGVFAAVDSRFNYDVSSDGKRFVTFSGDEQQNLSQINFIANWFEELKQRVPLR